MAIPGLKIKVSNKQPTAPAVTASTTPSTGKIPGLKVSPTKRLTPPTAPVEAPNVATDRPLSEQYFGTTTPEGAVLGYSYPEKDTSGRPFVAYRKPGDTATTTDYRRVATSFDPRVAQPLTKEQYYNPRAEGLREDLKDSLGIAYNEELDHQIALALSGSNHPANLKDIPTEKNRGYGVKEATLARDVANGKVSMLDAQIQMAKLKGIEVPYGALEKKGFLQNIKDFLTPPPGKSKATKSPLPSLFGPKKVEAAEVESTGAIPGLKIAQKPQTAPEMRITPPEERIDLGVASGAFGGVSKTSTPSTIESGSTIQDVKNVGKYLFDPKAEIPQARPSFTTPEEAEGLKSNPLKGPRAITGFLKITSEIVNRLPEMVVRGAAEAVSAKKQIDKSVKNLPGALFSRGNDPFLTKLTEGTAEAGKIDLFINPERLGYSKDRIDGTKIKALGEVALDRATELGEKYPNRGVLNDIQAYAEHVLPAIFDVFVTGDAAQSATKLLLSWTKSAPNLGISASRLGKLSTDDAMTEIVNRANQRAAEIRSTYAAKGGGLTPAGQRVWADTQKEINTLASALRDNTLPQLNAVGQILDDISIKLNQDLGSFGRNFSRTIESTGPTTAKMRASEATIPGYTSEARPFPAGASLDKKTPVGFGDKTPDGDIIVYKSSGGEKSAAAKSGFPTVGEGTYYSLDADSSKQFGDTTKQFILPKNAKIYDATKAGYDLSTDPLFRQSLKAKQDFTTYAKSQGYEFIKFTSDDGSRVWLAQTTGSPALRETAVKPEVFKGFEDVTTTVLDKLQGRDVVSKQFISDLTNSGSLKQVERDLIRTALESFGAQVPVKAFADKVKAELLPLDREAVVKDTMRAGQRELGGRYETVTLPAAERGSVENYSEHVYTSPIETSAGDIHFSDVSLGEKTGKDTRNYFGHTRVEDMADGETRRVIETQSDLYQKGRLENEKPLIGSRAVYEGNEYKLAPGATRGRYNLQDTSGKVIEVRIDDVRLPDLEKKLAPLKQYSNPTAHFRMVREEVKQAAADGKTKLQFPTGETALKIEGLSNAQINWTFEDVKYRPQDPTYDVEIRVTPENISVGREVSNSQRQQWVITDLLGDGKFKAVPKHRYEYNPKEFFGTAEDHAKMVDAYSETFDISGKVDTNNPIYRFYEKDLGRYLTNNYGAKRITDPQGVTWYEVPVKPEAAKQPVTAFKKTKTPPKFDLSTEKAISVLKQLFPEEGSNFVFKKEILNAAKEGDEALFNIIGQYRQWEDLVTKEMRSVIELVESGGKVPSTTLMHEAGHKFINEFVSPSDKATLLGSVRKNPLIPKKGIDSKAYPTREARLEEALMDDFVDYVKSINGGAAYGGKHASIWQRILTRIKNFIRKLQGLKKFYDDILQAKRPGKAPTQAIERKEISGGSNIKKIRELEKRLSGVYEEFGPSETSGFTKADEVLADLVTELDKATEKSVFGGETKFPSWVPKEYHSKVLAEKMSEYVSSINGIQFPLGRTKMDQQEFFNIILDEMDRRLGVNTKKIRESIMEEVEASMTDKTRAEMQADRTARQNVRTKQQELKRLLDETQKRLVNEEGYKAQRRGLIEEANRMLPEKSGLIGLAKEALAPLKQLDSKTQSIFKKWRRQHLLAKELAETELKKLDKPKFDEMQKIYDYQAGKPIANREQVEKIFDDLLKEAQSRGLDFEKIPNYLPQVYNNPPTNRQMIDYLVDQGVPPMDAKDYVTGTKELVPTVAKRLKLNPSFIKQRIFPDYKTAEQYGFKPKYKNIPALVAYYREEMEKTLANRELLEKLIEEAKVLPVEVAPKTWTPLNVPFSPKGYFAEPKLARMLNSIFKDPNTVGFIDLAMRYGATLSKAAQEIALSAGFPKTDVNFFSIGLLIKQMTSGDFKAIVPFLRANFNNASIRFFEKNQNYLNMMANQDIDLGGRIGSYGNLYRNIANASKGKEIWGKATDIFRQLFNEKTFGSFLPQLYVNTFKNTYKAAIEKGLTEKAAEKLAGDTTKAMFGLGDYLGRSETTQNTLSTFLFAPRFREGLISFYVNTFKGATTQGRNPAYKLNRRFLIGLILTIAAYDYTNKKLSGRHLWENEDGHELELRIPLKDGDTIVYVPILPSFAAFPRNILTGTLAAGTGNFEVALQKYGANLSQPIKLFIDILSNRDYFGREIYNEYDSPTEKVKKAAEYTTLSVNHPYFKELLKYWRDGQSLHETLVYMLELPIRFKSLAKLEQQEAYQAEDELRKQKYREKEAMVPTFEKINKALEAGDEEAATKIYNALPEGKKKIIDDMYKAQKASETRARNILIKEKARKAFDAVKAGNTQEADRIYATLETDKDRKVFTDLYNSLK